MSWQSFLLAAPFLLFGICSGGIVIGKFLQLQQNPKFSFIFNRLDKNSRLAWAIIAMFSSILGLIIFLENILEFYDEFFAIVVVTFIGTLIYIRERQTN